MLDWFWGMNLSRALTSSIKTQDAFKLMSSGRVQGPALKIIVDRERDSPIPLETLPSNEMRYLDWIRP